MLFTISFRSNPRRRGQAALCALLVLFTFVTTSSDAQDQRHRGRIAQGAPVALQPFTLDEPAPIRLAYYTPRAIPRAEPVRLAYYAPRAIPRAESVIEENQPDAIPQMASAVSGPTVNGRRAVLRNGIAYAPACAPATVKSAIWAANTLRRKPYVWGGGHGSFDPARFPSRFIVPAFSTRRFRRMIFSVMANAVVENGSQFMRGPATPLPLLPACDSIRPIYATAATPAHAGTRIFAILAASTRVTPSVCNNHCRAHRQRIKQRDFLPNPAVRFISRRRLYQQPGF